MAEWLKLPRLKEETAVSIHASCWWVLRGHVNSSPVTKALDQRYKLNKIGAA